MQTIGQVFLLLLYTGTLHQKLNLTGLSAALVISAGALWWHVTVRLWDSESLCRNGSGGVIHVLRALVVITQFLTKSGGGSLSKWLFMFMMFLHWCVDGYVPQMTASVSVLLMFVPRHLICVYTNCAYLCLCVHVTLYIHVCMCVCVCVCIMCDCTLLYVCACVFECEWVVAGVASIVGNAGRF